AFGRSDTGAHAALNADGWDGYPRTLHALLALLADAPEIGPVVFLCGDAHLGLFVEAEVELQGRRARFHVVHTAGLNTPYRFANAAQSDFLLDEDFAFVESGRSGRCRVRTRICTGAGFTDVELRRELREAGGRWRLDCRF